MRADCKDFHSENKSVWMMAINWESINNLSVKWGVITFCICLLFQAGLLYWCSLHGNISSVYESEMCFCSTVNITRTWQTRKRGVVIKNVCVNRCTVPGGKRHLLSKENRNLLCHILWCLQWQGVSSCEVCYYWPWMVNNWCFLHLEEVCPCVFVFAPHKDPVLFVWIRQKVVCGCVKRPAV